MIDLGDAAASLVAEGKGILACDESVETADKRLALYGVKGTPELRRKDRELFLACPGVEKYLSGVILFDETFKQKMEETLTPAYLTKKGIMPGIKVDQGIEPLQEGSAEGITNGIIGLPERLAAYAKGGARFTKWRAAIHIDGDRLPTSHALLENARRLGIFAHESQTAGLVPLIEPEVLLSGNHSRVRARAVLEETLSAVFAVLERCSFEECAVDHRGVILKTAMAVSGDKSGKKDTPEEVAEDTIAALMKCVPRQVSGIVFLSGGQSPDQATANLAAITRRAKEVNAPWPLTFSYSRALQEEALEIWKGKEENVPAARKAFMHRLELVAAALKGEG